MNFPSSRMSSLGDACTSSSHLSRNTFTMRAKFSFRLYRWRGVKNDKLTFPKSYKNELKKKVEKYIEFIRKKDIRRIKSIFITEILTAGCHRMSITDCLCFGTRSSSFTCSCWIYGKKQFVSKICLICWSLCSGLFVRHFCSAAFLTLTRPAQYASLIKKHTVYGQGGRVLNSKECMKIGLYSLPFVHNFMFVCFNIYKCHPFYNTR